MDQPPRHVGIILDGNRRFAKRLMQKPSMGHTWGAEKLEQLLEWGLELGVKELTLYCFSIQNFNRPKEEFDFLMNIFRQNFEKLKTDNRLEENRIRVRFIGRLWMLPEDIQAQMKDITEKTKDHENYMINLALAYGGREEVVDAAKKLAEQVREGILEPSQIDEKTFTQALSMLDDPDMVIRTGGEKRTSNFLIWQSNYSEWIFLDKMWPEFTKEDFAACIEEYMQRQSRVGK